MHGLVHKGLESYISHCFGADLWQMLCTQSGQPADFDVLAVFDDKITTDLLYGASQALDRPKKEILEDFGTFLMTSAQTPALRRLMRFGGVDFPDFLASLDDLPGRVALAVNNLKVPQLEVIEHGNDNYSVAIGPEMKGFAFVLVGILRSLADDYGVLADISHVARDEYGDTLAVKIFDLGFDTGRDFSLVGAT